MCEHPGWQECGHPSDCLSDDHEDEAYCKWCDQVASLQSQIDGLTKVLEDKAVIVNGGTLRIEGPIGYLVVHSGTVMVEQPEHRQESNASIN